MDHTEKFKVKYYKTPTYPNSCMMAGPQQQQKVQLFFNCQVHSSVEARSILVTTLDFFSAAPRLRLSGHCNLFSPPSLLRSFKPRLITSVKQNYTFAMRKNDTKTALFCQNAFASKTGVSFLVQKCTFPTWPFL